MEAKKEIATEPGLPTRLPITWARRGRSYPYTIEDSEGRTIAAMIGGRKDPDIEEDLRFITRAVNSFRSLKTTLANLADIIETDQRGDLDLADPAFAHLERPTAEAIAARVREARAALVNAYGG